MSQEFVSASASITTALAFDGELPESIQWMPPGMHKIMPSVNGKPKRMTITVTPALAQAFNEQLQELRKLAAAGQGDEPYLDFNHKDEERSAEVTELYWAGEDPMKGGIRARVKWSSAGKEAVLGRTYRRFSPTWDLDPNTLQPLGISYNLGGLVNRAAFRNIAPVIAKDGSASTSTIEETMMKEEFEKIVADALKPIGDRIGALEAKATGAAPATQQATATAAAAGAADIGQAVQTAVATAMKPFTTKLDEMETRSTKAQAKAAVQPHIDRGAISPQDADAINFWQDAWVTNAKHAEAQMAKLPGFRSGRLITGTRSEAHAAQHAEPEDQLMAKASDMVKNKQAPNLAEALIAQARSPEGQEQYKQFRGSFAVKAKNN